MKRLITIILLLCASAALAGYIVDTSATNPLSTDKIPIGRLKGGTSYTVTPDGLASFALKSGKPATFQSISTNSIAVPQGVDPQRIELFEAAANGTNKVVIVTDTALSGDIILTNKSDGLYKDDVRAVSW